MDRVGREIVLRRKVYAGFKVKTQWTFHKEQGLGCGEIRAVRFRVSFGFGYVLVLF